MARALYFHISTSLIVYYFLSFEATVCIPDCPTDMIAVNISKTCIKFFDNMQKNWNAAKVACNLIGADLVDIDQPGKNDFVQDQVDTFNQSFWIGLTQQKANYSNLTSPKPGAFLPKSPSRCMQINPNSQLWTPHNCSTAMAGFICEKRQTAIACRDGTFGRNCLQRCSPNCEGGFSQCDKVNGTCRAGCVAGYRGMMCDKECEVGTFGTSCSKSCVGICDKGLCNTMTGLCTLGCGEGVTGYHCQDECRTGTYGRNCVMMCSKGCVGFDKSCDPVDGNCTKGCLKGYGGKKCLPDSKAEESSSSAWGIIAPAMVLLVIASGVGYLCCATQDHLKQETKKGAAAKKPTKPEKSRDLENKESGVTIDDNSDDSDSDNSDSEIVPSP